MALQFVPMGEALGVEVRGMDPRVPVTGLDLESLLSAWRDNLVLLIRGTALADPELIAFARVFGALDPPGPNPYGATFLPDFPELNVISNVVEDGQPIGGLGAGEAVWHADDVAVRAAAQEQRPAPSDGIGADQRMAGARRLADIAGLLITLA